MLSSYPQLSPVGWGLSRNIRGLGRRFDQRKTLGLDELRQTHLRSHPVRKSDPLAACLSCGCLSCCLIGTVLDQQAELHGRGWSTSEVLGPWPRLQHSFAARLSGTRTHRDRLKDLQAV